MCATAVLESVTESLVVHWRPTVQYHAHRLDLLTGLRSEGTLDQWRVTPDAVGARTKSVQITMDEDGVAIYPRGILLDDEPLDALRRAFRCASPSSYHFTVRFQFLIPLRDTSYDEARRTALSQMSFGALDASDFALVLDGRVAENRWHSEVGVLSEEEVEPRLRRWISSSDGQRDPLPIFVKLPSEIPSVSLFIDLAWLSPDQDGRDVDSVEDIAGKIRNLRETTNALAAGIASQLFEDALAPVAGGLEQ